MIFSNMEDEPSFLWESNQQQPCEPNIPVPNESDFHVDVEDLLKEIHGISVEELEVELRRKEKELYLCSRLGLFLAQEVEELITQRRGIISDHTKLLLELQEYKDTRRSYLDISDGVSESGAAGKIQIDQGDDNVLQGSESIINQNALRKCNRTRKEGRALSFQSSVGRQRHIAWCSCGKKAFCKGNVTSSGFERSGSVESLDLVSNAESTMTSVSSVRELQQDLDVVQKSHDRIAKVEVQLDKTRAKYRALMTKYAHKLKELSRELGSCVVKARPYFEAVRKAKKCQIETQQAAIEYKRAVNVHKAARDMVKVAENRVMAAEDKLDPTWQEMLNHANIKVNNASQEKNRVHRLHSKAAKQFQDAEEKRNDLQQKLQRNIIRSKPYFEVQKEFQEKLETTTKKLNLLELKLMEARQTYSINLSRLKKSDVNGKSSDALQSLSERGSGVGAENPFRLLGDTVSALPKPAMELLERETVECPDGASKSNSDDLTVELPTPVRTKLRYNPYDLLYLTDLNSDSPSEAETDSNDDYLQDF